MGWPRKDETARIYQDVGPYKGQYFVMLTESRTDKYDAIANAYEGDDPSPCGCTVKKGYLQFKKRIQWDELPEAYQNAFRYYFDDELPPKNVRGFWRIGKQPAI